MRESEDPVVDAEDSDVSPPAWQDLMRQLYRIIAEQGDGKCLAWINPANGDPELGEGSEPARIIVPINHRAFDQRFAPYLVELDLSRFADDQYFQDSVAMAWTAWSQPLLAAQRGQPVCGWILTDTAASEVARYWANHCHLHVISGQTRLLRFHDPGVREMLWNDLNDIQRQHLLRPVNTVLAIDRHYELMRHDTPSIRSDADGVARSIRPSTFRLDEDQWKRVADYVTLHAAWVYGLSEGTLPRSRRIDGNVRASMAAAGSYGLQSEGDRMLFALLALRIGGAFHTDARLTEVWRLTADQESLADAMEQVFHLPIEELINFLSSS